MIQIFQLGQFPENCFCLGSLGGTLRRGASLRHEPRPFVSRNPIKEEDLDVLLNWESDNNNDYWQKIKSVREGTVWKKEIEDDNTWVLKVNLNVCPLVKSL